MSAPHFTGPTTKYWQSFQSPDKASTAPWQYGYPARLPNSRILVLPIRQLTSSEAVASLILNQASLSVHDELGEMLAAAVRDLDAEVVIGLPTLGLTLAKDVAKGLGKDRYVPLGYSRKFWYDDRLATEVSSITSPSGLKKLYLDPNQLSLVKGKKAIIIDDAVSSGKTLQASWDFLASDETGCIVLGAGVLMKQGDRWKKLLGDRQAKVRWVFESPLLKAVEEGWDIRE